MTADPDGRDHDRADDLDPAARDAAPEDPPDTRAVALVLDVDPEVLRQFVTYHPDPTLDGVLAMADRPPVAEDSRELVAEWLAAETSDADPDGQGDGEDPGGDPRGLMFHTAGEL